MASNHLDALQNGREAGGDHGGLYLHCGNRQRRLSRDVLCLLSRPERLLQAV